MYWILKNVCQYVIHARKTHQSDYYLSHCWNDLPVRVFSLAPDTSLWDSYAHCPPVRSGGGHDCT